VRVEGAEHEVVEYETFAPLALAGIDKGSIPDTVADRSIRVAMRRRRKHEPIEKLRRRGESATDGERLRGMWAGYVAANPDLVASLSGAYPEMPDELHDRAADIWEPVVAVADAAGDDWPVLVREAAKALTPSDEQDDEFGVTLLRDLHRIWPGENEVKTKTLVDNLCDLEDAPWSTFGKQSGRLSGRGLAALLRPFEIRPTQVGTRHEARGYVRSDFEDAWARYCDPGAMDSAGPTVRPVPCVVLQRDSVDAKCPTDAGARTHGNRPEPLQDEPMDTLDTSEARNHVNETCTGVGTRARSARRRPTRPCCNAPPAPRSPATDARRSEIFAAIDPLDVIDIVDQNGLKLESFGHRLYLGPPPVPPLIKELIAAHRELLIALDIGRRSGHVWGRCDDCGEGRLIRSGTSPRCAVTPGCEGRHVERAHCASWLLRASRSA
jgi:Protein of unknown function (DUF3631)